MEAIVRQLAVEDAEACVELRRTMLADSPLAFSLECIPEFVVVTGNVHIFIKHLI